MKFIIILLNVTNGTFIYSSGQPFKKLAPFFQSNRVVSFRDLPSLVNIRQAVSEKMDM
jgi:hypothetical protein